MKEKMEWRLSARLATLGAGLTLCWATNVQASSDALLNKLVQKGVLTQTEANELREDLDKEDAQTVELFNKMKVASWIDEMKWSSDLRLRYEYFDNADQTNPAGATNNKNDRTRFRFRLRIGLETKFQDWAKIGVRLASGGDDPVGTNQSFQDTFSRKSIGIDLAYVTLTPPFADWISVTGGKLNNPIWQPTFGSPMEYDYDLTPEGIAEQVAFSFGDNKQYKVFGNFGQFVLDEISGDENDPWMTDSQIGAEVKFGKDPKKPVVKITAAGGYLQTTDLKNMGVASGSQPSGAATPTAQSTSPNRGNATRQPGGAVAPGNTLFYLDDFQVAYGRGEVAWAMCDKPFLGTPSLLTFSGEYIHNLSDKYDSLKGSTQTKSPGQTDGWTAQMTFGQFKKRGEWALAYQYKYLEADATWDAVTDSDWGLGGTDREGHCVNAIYMVRDWWMLRCGAFITQKISSRPNSGENTRANNAPGKEASDLLRVQADTMFKF